MLILPSLRHLTYLLNVADKGSFSAAAGQCHVTQSTLSAGIKALEDQCGHILIDRSTRHARLTPAGEEVARYAREMLDMCDSMMHGLARRAANPYQGTLRLGIIPTIAPYLLPHMLPALNNTYPELDICLREDLSAGLIDRLLEGELDLLLMAFPYRAEHVEILPLFDEPFYLAGKREFLPEADPVTLDHLSGADILLLEEGHCLRDHALEACQLTSGAGQRHFSATSLSTLTEMASHGYGLTMLPAMAADKRTLPPALELRRFASPAPSRRIGLAWRKNNPRGDIYREIGRCIMDSSGKDAPAELQSPAS